MVSTAHYLQGPERSCYLLVPQLERSSLETWTMESTKASQSSICRNRGWFAVRIKEGRFYST
jgi:hypothetical protein